jgi:hypothetical protein
LAQVLSGFETEDYPIKEKQNGGTIKEDGIVMQRP